MASNNEGAYSALPQSMSDSDSDKELHDVQQRKYINHHASVSSNLSQGTLTKKTSNGYKYDYDKSATDYLNEALPPMSPMRRFLFYASIVCCLLTIIIFLWVLPCTEGSVCPVTFESLITKNWEKQYKDKEFTGTLHIVNGAYPKRQNMAVLYRNDVSKSGYGSLNGGVMSMLGTDGQEMWCIPTRRIPIWLDCDLIDVTGDDVNDCLLLGENGLLKTIDPVTGYIEWHVHSHNDAYSIISSVDVPLAFPDVDNDGVDDLLIVCSFNFSLQNYLTFVSGKVGNLIGKPLRLSECMHIMGLTVEDTDRNAIEFACMNDTRLPPPVLSLNISDVYNKILNKNVTLPKKEHVFMHADEDGYELNGRKLIITNKGTCPHDCQANVQLLDTRDGKNEYQTIQRGDNILVMNPVTFSFKSTPSNLVSLKGHIHGFIIKLWQWPTYTRGPLKNFWKADLKLSHNSSVHMITERVILISFNSTDVHVINASQTEIMQLCYQTDGSRTCQPSSDYQMNSLIVVDLDKDGSQELISFSSTHVDRSYEFGMSHSSFQLVSNVKVIQLETELPKLYEATSK